MYILNSTIWYYVFHAFISGRVSRTVCFSTHQSCRCVATMTIDVINCGSFYIYKTPIVKPRCYSRICLEKQRQRKYCMETCKLFTWNCKCSVFTRSLLEITCNWFEVPRILSVLWEPKVSSFFFFFFFEKVYKENFGSAHMRKVNSS